MQSPKNVRTQKGAEYTEKEGNMEQLADAYQAKKSESLLKLPSLAAKRRNDQRRFIIRDARKKEQQSYVSSS